jgi:uncharacterized ubiquitin-like protein YukD
VFQQICRTKHLSPSYIHIKVSGNDSYVGQTGRSLGIRHEERTRYIKTNNAVSAYDLHILNNKHECVNIKQTIELLKPCNKVVKMDIWESFFIHILQKQNLLSEEHKVNNPNPLYELSQDVALHN